MFTPDDHRSAINMDIDAIRDQIIEDKVASRMNQLFKSKDGDKRAETTPIMDSGDEEE